MSKSEPTTDELKRAVQERQDFLEKMISFTMLLLGEFGEELECKVYDCYISRKVKLEDFHGFSFYADGAYSMFGGQGIKIWHNPDQQPKGSPVLSLKWWDIKKLKVESIDPSPEWQKAILEIIGTKDRYIEQYREMLKAMEAQADAARTDAELRRELEKKAADLGI